MGEFELEDFGKKIEVKMPETNIGKDIQQSKPSLQEDKKAGVYTFSQWSEIRQGMYTATGIIEKKLSGGLYKIREHNDSYFFEKQQINVDSYIRFSDSIADKVLEEITQFWALKDKFDEYGFLHRRGYLLYGPQGGGKSILVQQIIQNIINNDGIAIWVDTAMWLIIGGMNVFRKVEPNRKIVMLFEDVDALIKEYGESELLSFLDGEGNLNEILCIATTNYPERLDKRIIARPRRFDRIIKIGAPTETVRREYFKVKANLNEVELEEWVNKTEGFSFAALADLIISVKCFRKDLEESINILKQLMYKKVSSEEFEIAKVGFNNNGH